MRLGLATLCALAAACDESHTRGEGGVDVSMDGGTDRGVGSRCVDSADCESGLCFPTAAGMAVCTRACTEPRDCPAGWDCGRLGGADACTCAASAEICNGVDDDCDARTDEGTAEAIGCGAGQLCAGGECQCPDDRMCGLAVGCADIDYDPLHCGRCDRACADGERCFERSCCAPRAESCDGVDQDCDGNADDGVRCANEGELCIDGDCVCPPERMCGGGCADISFDDRHCGSCDNACADGEHCVSGSCCRTSGSRVDLLFMVDNSSSMGEEQASLLAELPRVVRALASGDLDADGEPEALPVTDLHAAVVTSDLGAGGFAVPTCDDAPDFGDDGILRTRGRGDLAGCMDTYPPFLEFEPSGSVTADEFASQVACVAQAGTGGCGFEQPLEAILKAITPSGSLLRFHADTRGHGDAENAGFLREDSVLVIVALADENDCSVADPELFDFGSDRYTEDPNMRCVYYPEAQHPITRYVDGILALRGDPRDLIFATIAGIPVDLEVVGGPPEYDVLLGDPRMAERPDPSATNRLIPSCNVAGRGVAFPPRRLVLAARELERRGATSVIGSICQNSYAGPVGEILHRITERLGEVCRGE